MSWRLCQLCRPAAIKANHRSGRLLVPANTHYLMNGLVTAPSEPYDVPILPSSWVAEERQALRTLDTWERTVLGRSLASLPELGEHSIGAFRQAVHAATAIESGPSAVQAFLRTASTLS